MLETPHVVVAAAIAKVIPNPLLAIPLAFGSHFILELVPHWNPHLNTEIRKFGKVSSNSTKIVIFDSVLSLALGFSIALSALPNTLHLVLILAASFFGVLPDVMEAPFYFLNIKNKFIERTWIPFQKALQNDTSPLPGLTTQILTVLITLWWIFK